MEQEQAPKSMDMVSIEVEMIMTNQLTSTVRSTYTTGTGSLKLNVVGKVCPVSSAATKHTRDRRDLGSG